MQLGRLLVLLLDGWFFDGWFSVRIFGRSLFYGIGETVDEVCLFTGLGETMFLELGPQFNNCELVEIGGHVC